MAYVVNVAPLTSFFIVFPGPIHNRSSPVPFLHPITSLFSPISRHQAEELRPRHRAAAPGRHGGGVGANGGPVPRGAVRPRPRPRVPHRYETSFHRIHSARSQLRGSVGNSNYSKRKVLISGLEEPKAFAHTF